MHHWLKAGSLVLVCFAVMADGVVSDQTKLIETKLGKRTGLDDRGVSIYPFLKQPPEEHLVLPEIDLKDAAYLEVFSSHATDNDPNVSGVIVPFADGELLYMDLNNDEDLTNDGPPLEYRKEVNALSFDLRPTEDGRQGIGRLLQRLPRFLHRKDDEWKQTYHSFVDSSGNVFPRHTRIWQQHYSNFEGKAGTYYFYKYLHARRGIIAVGGRQRAVALWDGNSNGLFDDPEDLLLVDLNGDGMLKQKEVSEVFKLSDVFAMDGVHYRLSHIDPYGDHLRLASTLEPTTHLFQAEQHQLKESADAHIQSSGKLAPSFWALEFETIAGVPLNLRSLRGRHILFSFWGEWCAPCMEEMPTLVWAHKTYGPDRLALVGVLNTGSLARAKRAMEQAQVSWPQIAFDQKVEELFAITSWPTNILIMPDGEHYIAVGMVQRGFFEQRLE